MDKFNLVRDTIKAVFETLDLATSDATKNRNRYQQSLRANARGLWSGTFTRAEFDQLMFRSLDRGLRQAWNRGFLEYGITPDEQSEQERQYIFNAVIEQSDFIGGLASFIEANSKDNGGKLRDIYRRVDLWLKRYDTFFNDAKARAAGNRKMEWVVGDTEHCSSCLKLSGKVKRGDFWVANGILPQVPNAHYLHCKGFYCGCELKTTNKPMTRGPLPALP